MTIRRRRRGPFHIRDSQALQRARGPGRDRFLAATPTRRSASSGRTARARRRCSACWPARIRRLRNDPFPRRGRHRSGGAERCRLGIVRTHQIPQPFSGMTVFENVFVAATNGGQFASRGGQSRARSKRSRFAACCALANRRAETLGLLDRKRLELARALGANPVGAAARRNRRRPDRRRGGRTRRHDPSARGRAASPSSGSSISSISCCRSPNG